MRSSLLNNLCNDNDIENPLFFFTFTNFVNHVLKQSSRKTNRWVSFVKICNTFESKQFFIVLMMVKQFTMNHQKFSWTLRTN